MALETTFQALSFQVRNPDQELDPLGKESFVMKSQIRVRLEFA